MFGVSLFFLLGFVLNFMKNNLFGRSDFLSSRRLIHFEQLLVLFKLEALTHNFVIFQIDLNLIWNASSVLLSLYFSFSCTKFGHYESDHHSYHSQQHDENSDDYDLAVC